MAFSFRSFFGKDRPNDKAHGSSSIMALPPPQSGGHPFHKGVQGNPFASNGVFSSLSRQGNGAGGNGHALGGFGPFSPAASGLTVEDILPSLPPELVRHHALRLDQPLHLPEEVIEQAWRTGQASLPLFEIYRFCPALFQSPISPQDHRMVDLPPHKLFRRAANDDGRPPPAMPPQDNSLPQNGGSWFPSPFSPGGVGTPVPPIKEDASKYAPPPSPFQPLSPGGAATGMPSSPFRVSPSAFTARVETERAAPPFTSPFTPANVFPPPANDSSAFQPAPFAAFPQQNAFSPPAAYPEAPGASFSPSHQFPESTGPSSFGHFENQPAILPPGLFGPSPVAAPRETKSNGQHSSAGSQEAGSFFQPLPPPTGGTPSPQIPPAPGFSPPFFSKTPPSFVPEPSPPTVPYSQSSGFPPPVQAAAPVPQPYGTPFPEAPPTHASPSPFDRIRAMGHGNEPARAGEDPVENPSKALFGSFQPAPEPLPASFFGEETPHPSQSPSSLAAVPPAPGGLNFSVEAGPNPGDGQSRVTLSLASALARCTEQEIGVKPEMIPSWIQVSLPVTALHRQGGKGRMVVRIVEIMRGLEPEFRNILSPASPDVLVELPANEVFHALPGSPAALPARPLEPDALGSPDGDKPLAFPHASASQPAVPSLFREKQPSTPGEPPPPPSAPWSFENEPTPEAGGLSELSFPNPLFGGSAKDDPPAVGAGAATLSAGLKASSSPAAAPAGHPHHRSPGAGRNAEEKNRQLLLRVLLGTEELLGADEVIQLTGRLSGVSAAICLHRGQVLGLSSNGTPEAETFVRQAPLFQQHLRPLVQLTGIIDTETLSMKSDQQVVTFSIQQDTLLGVLHDPGKHEPTLQERITLIARELTALIEPPALQA